MGRNLLSFLSKEVQLMYRVEERLEELDYLFDIEIKKAYDKGWSLGEIESLMIQHQESLDKATEFLLDRNEKTLAAFYSNQP